MAKLAKSSNPQFHTGGHYDIHFINDFQNFAVLSFLLKRVPTEVPDIPSSQALPCAYRSPTDHLQSASYNL